MDRDAFRSGVDTIAEQCIGSRLRALNRFVTNIYDEALRPLGLKISQLNLLVAIAKMGEAKPAVLSELFHMDASTLSRNVDRMRQRGWITVSPGEDGRTVLLSLTKPGQELLQSAIAAWHTAQEQATDLLGQEGVSWLHELTCSLDRLEKKT
jgi:DNA-binding MarR family transcriptional regulator